MHDDRHTVMKRFWTTAILLGVLFLAGAGILAARAAGASGHLLTALAAVVLIWLAAVVMWGMVRIYRGLLAPLRRLEAYVEELAHDRLPEAPLEADRNASFPMLTAAANLCREILLNARNREHSLREWGGQACRNRDAAILRCRMLTGMAGEINRPLSLIHAYLYLRRTVPKSLPPEALHDRIARQLGRSQDLLARIARVGALSERPANASRSVRFGLAALLHQVVRDTAGFLSERRVSHLLRYDPDVPKEVFGDREALRQILTMQMRMLAGAGAEHAEIEISCTRSEEHLMIVLRCGRELPGAGGYAALLRRYHENEPEEPPPGAPLPLLRMLWIEAAAANLQAHFDVDEYGPRGTCFRLLLDDVWENAPAVPADERSIRITGSAEEDDDPPAAAERPLDLQKDLVVIGSDGWADEVLQALYPDCRLITDASPEKLPEKADLLLIFLCGDVPENWLATAELLLLRDNPPPLVAVVDTRNQRLIPRMRRAGGGRFLPAPTDFSRLDRILLRLLTA